MSYLVRLQNLPLTKGKGDDKLEEVKNWREKV
jgi:hypothetical protein